MCKHDERITPRLSGGVIIDAPIPENINLAILLLKKDGGYREGVDSIVFDTQYTTQYTRVEYKKTMPYPSVEGGIIREFKIISPNKYIPKEHWPNGIRCTEDI